MTQFEERTHSRKLVMDSLEHGDHMRGLAPPFSWGDMTNCWWSGSAMQPLAGPSWRISKLEKERWRYIMIWSQDFQESKRSHSKEWKRPKFCQNMTQGPTHRNWRGKKATKHLLDLQPNGSLFIDTNWSEYKSSLKQHEMRAKLRGKQMSKSSQRELGFCLVPAGILAPLARGWLQLC